MVMHTAPVDLHCYEDMLTLPPIDHVASLYDTHMCEKPILPQCTDTLCALSQCNTEFVSTESESNTDADIEIEQGDCDSSIINSDHEHVKEIPEQCKEKLDSQQIFEKYHLLGWMFAESKRVQMHREKLSSGVMTLRMACVRKIQQVLYYSQMKQETIVNEGTVIQAILLLDWIIQYELNYFLRKQPDVVAGVCVILSVEDPDMDETEMLYRLVAFIASISENTSFIHNMVREVADVAKEVECRYAKLTFTDFTAQYFGHDDNAMLRIEHFFYVFMTESLETWQLNIYELFVEIVLKESTDIQTHVDILDDYLRICV